MRVTREGRIVQVRAGATAMPAADGWRLARPLAPPAPGEDLAAWLAAAAADDVGPEGDGRGRIDPGVRSAPIVLVIRGRRGPSGPELLIAARREPSAGATPDGGLAVAGRSLPPGALPVVVDPAAAPAGLPSASPAAVPPSAVTPAVVPPVPPGPPAPPPAASPPPSGPARYPRRLVGFRRRRMFLFDPAHVLSFELHGGLVHAMLDEGETFSTNYSIRELESRLAGSDFFRVHRDVILNLDRVKEIERVGQGRLRLLLDTSDAKGFTASRPASARLRRLLRL